MDCNNPFLINSLLRILPGAKTKTRFSSPAGCIRDLLTSRAHHSYSVLVSSSSCSSLLGKKGFPQKIPMRTAYLTLSSLPSPTQNIHLPLQRSLACCEQLEVVPRMEYYVVYMLSYASQVAITASPHAFSGTTSLHDFMPVWKLGELILWSRGISEPIHIQWLNPPRFLTIIVSALPLMSSRLLITTSLLASALFHILFFFPFIMSMASRFFFLLISLHFSAKPLPKGSPFLPFPPKSSMMVKVLLLLPQKTCPCQFCSLSTFSSSFRLFCYSLLHHVVSLPLPHWNC